MEVSTGLPAKANDTNKDLGFRFAFIEMRMCSPGFRACTNNLVYINHFFEDSSDLYVLPGGLWARSRFAETGS